MSSPQTAAADGIAGGRTATAAGIHHYIRSHFLVATAYGLLGGLLDGLQQFALRGDPVTRASEKVGGEVLWLSPVAALLFAVALAVVSLPLVVAVARLRPAWASRVSHLLFAALACWLALSSTGRVHLWAIYALVIGVVVRVLSASPRSIERMNGLAARATVTLAAGTLIAYGAWATLQRLQLWRLESTMVAASPGSPSVLLIVLDTFRRDLFDRPGMDTLLPNLARLRDRGVEFSDAWATTTWSLPSQASILTGMFPDQHGADWPRLRYNDSVRTLPELLLKKGYVTGAFSGNFSWVTPEYLGRGFLHFVSYNRWHVLRHTSAIREARHRRWLDDRVIEWPARSAADVRSEFLRFVDRDASRPFFAYICFMDVNHAIYDTQRRLVGTRRQVPNAEQQREIGAQVVASYFQAAVVLDREVGALLDSLDRRGRLRETLVIVTADHGESFGPAFRHDQGPSGHATSLYPEQGRVPLVIAGPGVPTGLSHVTRAVSLRDLMATIGAAAGIESPGRSLLAVARDSLTSSSPVLLSLHYRGVEQRGIVNGDRLYIEYGFPHASKRDLIDLRDTTPAAARRATASLVVMDSLSRELRAHWPAR